MKGITRTAAEVELHDKVAQLGCICCRIDGFENTWISIHHANGRTKPGCHQDVLPLCAPHHVKERPDVLARHGDKRAWESLYGKEYDLIEQVMREVGHPYLRPELRERPAPSNRKKSPSINQKAIKPADVKPIPKRQIPTGKLSRPAVKAKLSSPPPKPKPSDAQLRYAVEQKTKQKAQQSVRQAEYALEHKDKIEAMKDKAREQAKAQRQKIAAERKAKAKADKAKAKRAA